MTQQKQPLHQQTHMRFLAAGEAAMAEKGMNPSRQIVQAWFGAEAFLNQVPEHCPVKVTGRSQFKLFVNGEALLFGPLRSRQNTSYYDELDLASHLKPGNNHLLMQVLSYPEHPVDPSQAGPNHCYGDDNGPAIAMQGCLGDVDLSLPDSWYFYLDESMRFNDYEIVLMGATEIVDGAEKRKNPLLKEVWESDLLCHPVAESAVDFDSYGVRQAKTVLPRPIPLLYRKEKRFSDWEECTIPATSREEYVLDAGELTTAYFRIGFSGGTGSRVQITYAESYYLQKDGQRYKGVRDDSTGFIDGVCDSYIVEGGDTVYEPFRFRTFRFVRLTIETSCEALTVRPLPYVETAYPLENRFYPNFSDSKKERLYRVALRTLQLCMHDTYEDCPYYEQLMYTCDTRLEMLFTYECSGDTRLAAHCIDLFASSLLENGLIQSRFPSREMQIIPMFSLYFILMLEDYLKESGDEKRIARHLPVAEKIVETFLGKRCADGLIAPQGYWDYFDWTEAWEDRHGTPTAALHGASAIQNLLFVYALQSLIRMLPRFHRESLAQVYEKEAEKILTLVRQTCFDEARGLFREGPDTYEYSQHAQIFAVLTGLVTGEAAARLMEKVLEEKDLIPCSFVQKFYLFRALEQTGLYHRTEELWPAWEEYLDLHCTTFPETPFNPRSDCHAWSALPLYEFSSRRAQTPVNTDAFRCIENT